ncbi:MAG: UDP-2,3-diacylglucosamine diphosphatase LpxI [Pseudomonadota bacterium]
MSHALSDSASYPANLPALPTWPARIGIIAGQGALPRALIRAAHDANSIPFVIAFQGITPVDTVVGVEHVWVRLGEVSKILKALRRFQAPDIVLCGAIPRPNLWSLWPDWQGLRLLLSVRGVNLGDDTLLRAVKDMLSSHGFTVRGIQNFLPDLLTPPGNLGKVMPSNADWVDIRYGAKVARTLGRLDIGQAVIVEGGNVLSVEAAEGTDALISRTTVLKRQAQGGVLVKLAKPQQERAIDLPTIGPQTVRQAISLKLSGIAVEAGHSLCVAPEEVVQMADQAGLFIYGLSDHEIPAI